MTEKLYSPETKLLNTAADAGIPPWEMPNIAAMTEKEMKKMTAYIEKNGCLPGSNK